MYMVTGRATTREVAAMRKADEKEARREARAEKDRKRASFWDNVDTSAGVDGCHTWTGRTNSNRNTDPSYAGAFDYGEFREDGCKTQIATRVLCFKLYGKEPPRNMDITPTCRNHMCCNTRHLLVAPKSRLGVKLQEGIPLEQFFCEPVGAN